MVLSWLDMALVLRGALRSRGARNSTAASEDDATDAQANACIDKPTTDASGEFLLSVYAAEVDAVHLNLWKGDMTIQEGDLVCS